MRVKDFVIKALDESSEYQFDGYASTYENEDRDKDIMKKGCFDNSLKKKSTVPLLYNHDRNKVIGKLELSSDSVGLFSKGYLNLADEKAKNVYDLIKMGALDSMSIGFIVKDYELIDKSRPFGGWEIKEAEVVEVSIVTVPANDQALITNIKSFDKNNQEEDLKNLIKEAIKEFFKEKADIEARRKALLDKFN